jgi:hypothetical protein
VSIRLKDKEIAQFARGEAFQLFEKKLKRFELFQPAGSGLRIKRQKDELLYQLDVPVKIMMENHNQQA